ncbi:MAG: class I SAM-dependent methyltransferase [Clostridia bacterium]|nr:class I SAM-dependent methyltransferase [Clostridia bacterium]
MSDLTIRQWNTAALLFADTQERSAYAESNKTIVKQRFRKLNGETVLDLGCGYGWYADYFRGIGGSVTGVDGAEAMLDLARERTPDVSFFLADITRPLPFAAGAFDIVFCNQVLMDIENVGPVFSECARLLKPGGVFWYSIVHPAFYVGNWQTDENGYRFGRLITSYLSPETTVNRFWGETAHFHRPLSCYLNAAADAGLILTHTEEPRSYDKSGQNDDLPLFFFAEYRKPE